MSREFGIYPETSVPKYWIGCRGIIGYGYKGRTLDIPWDRWSSEFHLENRKQELIDFVNEEAISKLEELVKKCKVNGWGYFDSKDGKFRCEYDTKNSGGYLYAGFYNITIEEDE